MPTTAHCHRRVESMAVPSHPRSSLLLLLLLLFITSISRAAGGIVGVDYGRNADGLIPPEQVVQLLKNNGIGAASIYDADPGVLNAFKGSGIKLMISLPNEHLADAARDPNYAGTWVGQSVGKYFPATQINSIAVGNEVFDQRPDLTSSIVPAMQNVYNALVNLRLADAIKVSSPVSFAAVSVSFPPSKGIFRSDLQPVIRDMLDFYSRTNSYFTVNIFPYLTYVQNYPKIPLDYALGLPNNQGVQDPNTGLTYHSLLDAQLDAAYTAMAGLGFAVTATSAASVGASLQQRATSRSQMRESGVDHGGSRPRGRLGAMEKRGAAGGVLNTSLATVQEAQQYNNILVQRVLSGKTGTPLHPDADMDVYIFSLFDENQKPGDESEKHYGIFYPDGTPVYHVDFGQGDSWCVAKPAVGAQRMQAALDWACGQGRADCGPIQPGAPCYQPNTVEAHASYAMNSYYQRQGRGAGTCEFNGVGRIVYQRPRYGNCELPSSG